MAKKKTRQQEGLGGEHALEDIHDYLVDRHTFTIFLHSDPKRIEDPDSGAEPGVEFAMANRLEKNLSILSGINPRKPVLINMSSCGGDMYEGFKMFSAILACPNPVTILATKWARSMTSIIPLAADRFLIRPPAQYMIHYGQYFFGGLDQEADTADIERRKFRELMLRVYVARLKEQGKFKTRSGEWLKGWLEEKIRQRIDVFLSADEATEIGFADGVYVGDLSTLRARKKNEDRRQRMFEVIREGIIPEVSIK